LKDLKASILIANYNNHKYIKQCFESLFKQSFKNFEIIFHDDFSNDESLKKVRNIVKKKNNKKIKILINKARGKKSSFNQIDAYERSFNKSKGEIIFFLDSDDYFKKNKIEKIISIFDKKKDLLAIYDLPIIKKKDKIKIIKNKKNFFDNYWPYLPPQSCISIRRSEFKKMINKIKIKKFYDIWMDFRIAIYLIYLKNKFYILNKNLTYYRQTDVSISSKFKYNSKNWWQRRSQAHDYIKYFFVKNKIPYKKNIDFFLTKFINMFI
tara:strand:- start:1856 stop:2653 length:798 start_codon:yes stop_codon:yes gene_type:complete